MYYVDRPVTLSRHTDTRVVNIPKVYIENNNMQLQ